MAVHIFDAEDSDGDSWMEVVEGSPGPSMQNSRASLIYDRDDKVDSTRRTASWVADDSWVSEFEEGYKDIERDYDTGKLWKERNIISVQGYLKGFFNRNRFQKSQH